MLVNTMISDKVLKRNMELSIRVILALCLLSHTLFLSVGIHSNQAALDFAMKDPLWLTFIGLGNFALVSSLAYDAILSHFGDKQFNSVEYWLLEKYRVLSYFFVGTLWVSLAYKVFLVSGWTWFHAAVLCYSSLIVGLIIAHAIGQRCENIGVKHCAKRKSR